MTARANLDDREVYFCKNAKEWKFADNDELVPCKRDFELKYRELQDFARWLASRCDYDSTQEKYFKKNKHLIFESINKP